MCQRREYQVISGYIGPPGSAFAFTSYVYSVLGDFSLATYFRWCRVRVMEVMHRTSTNARG